MARNTRGSARIGVGVVEPTEADLTQRIKSERRTTRGTRFQAEEVVEGMGPETTGDPLYPVALLKIAMAMRRLAPEEEVHFDAILEEVMGDLLLDTDDFRRYLDRNRGRLMAAVRARGY